MVIYAPLTERLGEEGLTLDDVPAAGRVVRLRDTANLSTGGEALDRTDDVHPAVAALAERAALAVGLDVAGIDLITTDITRSPAQTGCGIIEVNAAPGLRMHVAPSSGAPRDVARPIIEAIYPRCSSSRIPVVSVTGTNGKSTTVRMIAHVAAAQRRTVGMTTTSGVSIGGHPVRTGDSSGPRSARLVLADPSVDVAVLETARGGILREGLAYDRADVGVVLNVSADHLGLGGIDTVARLARVKSVVARNVRRRGTTVLNADDRWTRRMARVAGGRVAWFTMDGDDLDADLRAHLDGGGTVAAFEASSGDLVLHADGRRHRLLAATEIPATHGGAATFNIANALAAVAASHALGVPATEIAAALATFSTSFDDNPGRFNVTDAPGFTTVVDYAHNPAALRELGAAIRGLRPAGRTIGVISTPGDRRDDDIEEMGAIAVEVFDEVVFREPDDARGRAPGEISRLLERGARAAGADAARLRRVRGELAALDAGMRLAGPDDLVVMTPTDVESVWAAVLSFRERADSVSA